MVFQKVDKFRKSYPHRDLEFQRFIESHFKEFQNISERESQCSRDRFRKFQRNTENYRYLHIFNKILGELHRVLFKKSERKDNGGRDFSDTLTSICQESLRKLLTFCFKMKSPFIYSYCMWMFSFKYNMKWGGRE